MAVVRPFRAVRPTPAVAAQVAAVPYDVVDTVEARALAAPSRFSFLHVSRAEIDLPAGTDPHSDLVYETAARRYQELKHDAPLVQEAEPSFYFYELGSDGHIQTGLAACYSLEEYDGNTIRKHERTRKDKEDDRTRHIVDLRAQTGPVFLIHAPQAALSELAHEVRKTEPVFDFEAIDGVRHTIWRVAPPFSDRAARAMASVDALYIADGHHRAASAARARQAVQDSEEARWFLGVAFPADQARILPYNRVVRDLNGMTPQAFLAEMNARFSVAPGPALPGHKGEMCMYLDGGWHWVDLESGGAMGPGVIDRLDCNLLQERVLTPLLGIGDIRTDPRIDFVGGARGTKTLEKIVNSGKAAVAFSMYPVSVVELMQVSDAGAIMPPKSTWFEPKLRDGLLIHEI